MEWDDGRIDQDVGKKEINKMKKKSGKELG